MLRPAAALLFVLTLSVPVAFAEHDASAGPASVTTQNSSGGDGCAEGGNGSASRHAEARVDATPHESFIVLVSQSCYAWNQTWDDGNGGEEQYGGTSDQGVVMAGRSSDGNVGPVAQAGYMDSRQWSSSWGASRSCFSYLYASGPGVSMGCWPADAGRWPMMPELP